MLQRDPSSSSSKNAVTKNETELLKGLLQFDSTKRWDTRKALNHAYFKNIKTRKEDIEKAEDVKPYLDWGGDGVSGNRKGTTNSSEEEAIINEIRSLMWKMYTNNKVS